MPSQEFGALLASVRRRSGLTQAQLARISGINISQLASYESGARDPGAMQLMKIARALDLDLFGEAVPREEPIWVEEFRSALARIEAAVQPRELASVYREVVSGERTLPDARRRTRAG